MTAASAKRCERRHVAAFLFALSATVSCRQIAGLEDLPTPCASADSFLIDDMEDGDASICELAGRHGTWWTAGDGSGTLDPAEGPGFKPAEIPGGRGQSRKAAHMSGSGFSGWGAIMGLNLNLQGLTEAAYNAGPTSGIKFWMKSNTPSVRVSIALRTTIPVGRGGLCMDSATTKNCDNEFSFNITVPDPDRWIEYEVPYSALRQSVWSDANGNYVIGSVIWDTSELTDIKFSVLGRKAFNVWIDDISFEACGACPPTCNDPRAPVACRASHDGPADCGPPGTDCGTALRSDLYGIAGSGSDNVWIVGWSVGHGATVLHGGRAGWTPVSVPVDTSLNAVWTDGAADAWVVGDFGRALHWDGSTWKDFATGVVGTLMSVWGSGPDDVWAVGPPGSTVHWDGATWSPSAMQADVYLWRVWGSAADDVWAVGEAGTIEHWDGPAWSRVASGSTSNLEGIWGSGPDDVWIVGSDGSTGTILHWDGAVWSSARADTTTELISVWGSAANDVWAVGISALSGSFVHWNGSAWAPVDGLPGAQPTNLWGSGRDDIWAIGNWASFSTIVHWDGAAWSNASP